MSVFQIPCVPAGASHWKQRTALDGTDYILVFEWLQRDGHWLLHVLDLQESPIASGLKLVTNWPLLRGVTDPRRPPGNLFVWDALGLDDDPTFDGLGTRFVLAYASVT